MGISAHSQAVALDGFIALRAPARIRYPHSKYDHLSMCISQGSPEPVEEIDR